MDINLGKMKLDYLSNVNKRLQAQGFAVKENVSYRNQIFEYTAKRTRFEVEKFGYATTFFLFAGFDALDIGMFRKFSGLSFRYAKNASGLHPPRGIFYGIFCFPVAIVDTIDTNMVDVIHKKDPPKHWAAAEMPVVYSLKQKSLIFCETTPTWGSLYYDGYRQLIKDVLSP